MNFRYFWILGIASNIAAQSPVLSVDYIMKDPKWIGVSPSNPQWSNEGNLYFNYNPSNTDKDSLFVLNDKNLSYKNSNLKNSDIIFQNDIIYNKVNNNYIYNKYSDIFYVERGKPKKRLFKTAQYEWALGFDGSGSKVIYSVGNEIYSYNLSTGQIVQHLKIEKFIKSGDAEKLNPRDLWLENEQIALFQSYKKEMKSNEQPQKNKDYYTYKFDNEKVLNTGISNDFRVVAIRCSKDAPAPHKTIMPIYVTKSGYTDVVDTRPKVGESFSKYELKFYDYKKDTTYILDINPLPGIKSIPAYLKDYPAVYDSLSKKLSNKDVNIFNPLWQPEGYLCVIQIYSFDNKDRWIVLYNIENNSFKVIDHQHDDAWIGGPNIGGNYWPGFCVWQDNTSILYASEKSGYSHIYRYNILSGNTESLTSGRYEVQNIDISRDKKTLYIVTNQTHPGSKTFVHLDLVSKKQSIIIDLGGGLQDVSVSPDNKKVVFLASTPNCPNELYIADNIPKGKVIQITRLARSEEFSKYHWRIPEIVTYKAKDGVDIYARLYRPAIVNKNNPAVIFVHGAGYLQNAHKWWSTYFREYMFHNMLADLGYTVLDIDYRASSGYGRDWRTAIYRHMGGTDLSDQVDGAKYLVEHLGVNKENIGIYGGSYGGFITLMALFTKPGIFKAGAALRPVTDWSHYNHGYTSNILNIPVLDSIAYARSSPINFADGLKDRLLICHGMVDDNVHFQDVVRLQQVLIEKGKNNWELAAYPLESHGFKSPAAWTDEYKRIFNLFETTINKSSTRNQQ
jgi:dipeptidyl aminopeptidase/acylaminoacyl peptidase